MEDRVVQAGFWARLRQALRQQGIYLWIAAGYLAAKLVLMELYPQMAVATPGSVLAGVASMLVLLLLALVCLQFLRLVCVDRPRRPLLALLRSVRGTLSNSEVMARGLPVLVSLFVFIDSFSTLKSNIQVFNPVYLDQMLDRWDSALHAGRRPWEWLQPLLGHWPVTLLICLVYHLWFIVMLCIWVQFAFLTPPCPMRSRFLLSFFLVWMVEGSIFAIFLSSAGPCYFGAGRLGFSPDPYAGLMAYLRQADQIVPIWSVGVQDAWWALHRSGSPEAGISAMPSLHNGTALLFALASTGWAGWVSRLLWLNVALIFLGSIHLGWHYAIDSYVAWALTALVWQATGPLARLKHRLNTGHLRPISSQSPASL